MLFDRKFLNILQMGLGFFLVFTAYQSCANIQQFVMESVAHQRNGANPPIDSNAGYISSAIVYGFFTFFNFVAPAIVNVIGEKWSMVAGGVFYLLYVASFLYVTNYFLYVCSALLGLGAAVIWVGQGSYLAKNSDDVTASRNSGIFWAMFQCSLFVGGIFVYFELSSDSDTTGCDTQAATTVADNSAYLSMSTINTIYICFTVLAAVGIIVLALLRHPRQALSEELGHKREEQLSMGLVPTFVRTLKLFTTLPMGLLSVVFVYTGLEQGYWSGVYGTSLADTLQFPSHKELLALNGIFIGIGETVGGLLFGIFGKQVNKFGRIPVVFLGLTANMTCFLLIFLNISNPAPNEPTCNTAYITPNQYLALFCSFLLGFADACWNTQIYSLLSTYYSKDSAPAFGLYKFFQAGASCVAFFYTGSGQLYTQWQLLILAIACPIATLCFVNAQWIMDARPLK